MITAPLAGGLNARASPFAGLRLRPQFSPVSASGHCCLLPDTQRATTSVPLSTGQKVKDAAQTSVQRQGPFRSVPHLLSQTVPSYLLYRPLSGTAPERKIAQVFFDLNNYFCLTYLPVPGTEPIIKKRSDFYGIFCLDHSCYLIRSTFPARKVFAPESGEYASFPLT